MDASIDKRQALFEIYKKLERRHRINKWINLTLSIFLIGLVFTYLDLSEAPGFLGWLGEVSASFWVTGFAGSMLGWTWKNWSGTDELKLAEALFVVTAEE